MGDRLRLLTRLPRAPAPQGVCVGGGGGAAAGPGPRALLFVKPAGKGGFQGSALPAGSPPEGRPLAPLLCTLFSSPAPKQAFQTRLSCHPDRVLLSRYPRTACVRACAPYTLRSHLQCLQHRERWHTSSPSSPSGLAARRSTGTQLLPHWPPVRTPGSSFTADFRLQKPIKTDSVPGSLLVNALEPGAGSAAPWPRERGRRGCLAGRGRRGWPTEPFPPSRRERRGYGSLTARKHRPAARNPLSGPAPGSA